ncbi:MAG: thiol:disulfide interchange protein [Epsilonproteobacteria bacterium]|nr:MAG: thiol:disulfide interchange protein [Campylobacterota bacterium]
MKNILVILLFVTALFSNNDFLEPDKAFNVKVNKTTTNIEFKVTLDKSIYVYDEYLKVSIVEPKNINLIKELKLPKSVEYHNFIVHMGTFTISVPLSLIESKIGKDDYKIEFEYQGCSKKGICYSPMKKTYSTKKVISNNDTKKVSLFTKAPTPLIAKEIKKDVVLNETDNITQTLKSGSIWMVLITFFGFGLLLALTPCIFPMIPILSSIIVQHSNKDGGKMSASKGFILSLIYVLSMSIAYTVAGVLAGLFGANIQAMLQNTFVIVGFSAVFVALAFSMFGYYELALPSSWQTALNKTSDNSSKSGGIFGIAIMGFLSALIVGPCVAPPLAGALVYIGQTGDAILGGLALFVMSLGMGVPLLAIGIGAGKYMPKPGGWMMVVSKVFGVVMLGVAIWMLDRIVPSIVTIILAVILLLGSAYYLIKNGNNFGKIVAITLVVISIIFIKISFDDANSKKLPFQYIKTVKELDNTIATSNKPIMIDFWATWCVSCIEFDKITFKDKEVKDELSKYTLLKVDVTKNTKEDKELMKKFNLFGPPAMIFYKNGKEEKQKRMIGFKNPQDFLNLVK